MQNIIGNKSWRPNKCHFRLIENHLSNRAHRKNLTYCTEASLVKSPITYFEWFLISKKLWSKVNRQHKIFRLADCRRALLDLWRSIFGRTVRTKGWANNTSQDWMRSKSRMPGSGSQLRSWSISWSWSLFMVNFMRTKVTLVDVGVMHLLNW